MLLEILIALILTPGLFHHLHHHAHWAGHLPNNNGRCVLKSFGQSHFRDNGLQLVLEPETVGGHVILWDATRLWYVLIYFAEVLCKLFIRGLNIAELLALVLLLLLEADLVDVIREDQDVDVCSFKGFHERGAEGWVGLGVHYEVDFLLGGLHLGYIVIEGH